MPRRTDLRSVLVIGSGPIVIGQACEFDYSGTQAATPVGEALGMVLAQLEALDHVVVEADVADRRLAVRRGGGALERRGPRPPLQQMPALR